MGKRGWDDEQTAGQAAQTVRRGVAVDEGGIGGAAAGAFLVEGFEGGAWVLGSQCNFARNGRYLGDHSGSEAPNQKSNDIQAT